MHSFKIEIKKDMFKIYFLDVTLSLRDDTYELFKKKNCKVMYIHSQSNHPRLIRKSLTHMVSKRLSKLSIIDDSQTTNRGRNILYFNPHFSNNVKTKLGKEFLK